MTINNVCFSRRSLITIISFLKASGMSDEEISDRLKMNIDDVKVLQEK